MNFDFSNNKNSSFDVVNPSDLESKSLSGSFDISMNESSGYQNNNWRKPAVTGQLGAFLVFLPGIIATLFFSVLIFFFPVFVFVGAPIAFAKKHRLRGFFYLIASILGMFYTMTILPDFLAEFFSTAFLIFI